MNQNLVLVTLLSYKIPKLPLRSELQDLVRSLKLPPRLEQQDLGKSPNKFCIWQLWLCTKPQASSAFAQSSGSPFSGFAKSGSTSSGFAKLGSGGPSIFGDKTSSPVSTPLADESKELEEESEISLPEESDYSDEEELATDDANTSKDLEEVEGENVTETQEEKVETEIPPLPIQSQYSFLSLVASPGFPSQVLTKSKTRSLT